MIVLSGHHAANAEPQPDLWPGAVPEDATIAVYMPGRDLAEVAASLTASGLPPGTPCVAVTDTSRPETVWQAARLRDLGELSTSAAPTVLLVGQAFEAVLARDEQKQAHLTQ